MAKYVFVYHGGTNPQTPSEVESVQAQWSAWFDSMGEDVLDQGDPVGLNPGSALEIKPMQKMDNDPLTGFSLIEAYSLDDAISKAQKCPILAAHGSVELTQAQIM